MKTEFPDKLKNLTTKLAYSYDYFDRIEDYQKHVDNLKKKDFFSKLKNDFPCDKEKARTKEIFKIFNIKSGEELTKIF